MLKRPTAIWAAPLIVLVLALATMTFDPGGYASVLRGAWFDTYQRHASQTFADSHNAAVPPVRVVEIDPASIAKYGVWPWGWAMLARLAGELQKSGAGLVVFAFPLISNDAAPQNLLAQIPPGVAFDPARTEIASLPAPEDRLGEALQGVKAVTGVTLGTTGRAPTLKARFVYIGAKPPFAYTPFFDTAAAAPAPVQAASAGIGVLNLMPDADGTIRRMPLLFRLGTNIAPSLDAEALRIVEGAGALTVKDDETGLRTTLGLAPSIAALEARHEIATAQDGSFWMVFWGPHPQPLSLSVLQMQSSSLGGAVVFVGAPGARVMTPLGPSDAASVFALGLENLLTGRILTRPANARIAEALWLIGFGLGTIFLGVWFGPAWAGLLALGASLGGGFIAWNLFAAHRLLFDAACPGTGLALVFASVALARVTEIGATRALLRIAYAESFSPAAVEKIARQPSLLRLDGQNRTVTYLVCAVRGFSELAASFQDKPSAFIRLLERVLAPLMDQVLLYGGTVHRLTADGFTAFWNAPLDDPAHALHACEAASGMSAVASRINESIAEERRLDGTALPVLDIGIGIATGGVIVGGFRTYGRAGYGVTGHASALAGRIQLLSPQYGAAVIVSEETAHAAERSFAFLEIDTITTNEDGPPTKVYALLGNPVTRASPKFRALQTFHKHIFQALRDHQWKKARDLIEQCRKLSGASQKLYDLHLARIGYFESNPPAADWDGAFRSGLK